MGDKGAKARELFFAWLQWMLVSYVLTGAVVSLKASPFSILLFAANVAVLVDYWRVIRGAAGAKAAAWVFLGSLLTLGAAFAMFGYLPVGEPVKFF